MSVKLAIAQINCALGDLSGNSKKILEYAELAAREGVDILITPELSITGYPPEDLLLDHSFYTKINDYLKKLAQQLSAFKGLYVIVGHPSFTENNGFFSYHNSASVFLNGEIVTTYFKRELPNYGVFDEKRYFQSGSKICKFFVKNICFAINICEDAWVPETPLKSRQSGADVLLLLNASPYSIEKFEKRRSVLRSNVISQGMSLVYTNLVGGQDELVFDGGSFIMNDSGKICLQLNFFSEDFRYITFDKSFFKSKNEIQHKISKEKDIYSALVLSLKDYFKKNNYSKALIGLSGGIDSALTLAITVDALGAKYVRAVMMPSIYTSEISWLDSREMVKLLNVNYIEIPIKNCFDGFRSTLNFEGKLKGIVEENLQSRIRGTLLMALSNQTNSLVVTTGNKSELATGYCTLYGDMVGAFAIIKDIYKTLVYELSEFRNTISHVIPQRIIDRPPTAELRPNQTDEDSLLPYEILDKILYLYIEKNTSLDDIEKKGFDRKAVKEIIDKIKLSEYKRSQAPIGPIITEKSFGKDWRFPITSKFKL